MGPVPSDRARVGVRAIGLNFADIFACLGLYSATPHGEFVPGLEFCGIVDELGSGVDSPAVGTPVFGLTRFGGYATRIDADPAYLVALPTGWEFAHGAAYPVQALTAWYAIRELGRIQQGQSALVHSAAGGVGLNALALLDALGARVIATVGCPEKVSFLVDRAGLRPEQVIVRDRRTFGDQLDAALQTNRLVGFDLVLDSVAGPFFQPAFRRLRPGGKLVIYGAADFMPAGTRPNWPQLAWRYLARTRVDPVQLISDNRSVMGFNLIWLWDRVDRLGPSLNDLAQLLTTPPFIGKRFAFDEAPAAMRHLQSGASVGKVVLEIEPA